MDKYDDLKKILSRMDMLSERLKEARFRNLDGYDTESIKDLMYLCEQSVFALIRTIENQDRRIDNEKMFEMQRNNEHKVVS